MSERTYRVSEVYCTLQGEGLLVGTPVVLLRLQGCAVGCSWCDTKYSWAPDDTRLAKLEWAVDELVQHVCELSQGESWVLLTGGEPCEQAPLEPLVRALHSAGFKVMLETSGTAALDCPGLVDHLCCSPKDGMPGGKALVPEVLLAAHELKFVVGQPADVTRVEELLARHGLNHSGVTLQPLGGPQKAATSATTLLCLEAARVHGWRVSLQTHKMSGLP